MAVVVVAGQERVWSGRLEIRASCLAPSAWFVCSRVSHVLLYKVLCHLVPAKLPSIHNHHPLSLYQPTMPAKPSSTAGKAPASTASKAPAKTTSDTSKAAKKTSKPATSGTETEGKKKRRKGRKETYSSYIYKGTGHFNAFLFPSKSF